MQGQITSPLLIAETGKGSGKASLVSKGNVVVTVGHYGVLDEDGGTCSLMGER